MNAVFAIKIATVLKIPRNFSKSTSIVLDLYLKQICIGVWWNLKVPYGYKMKYWLKFARSLLEIANKSCLLYETKN